MKQLIIKNQTIFPLIQTSQLKIFTSATSAFLQTSLLASLPIQILMTYKNVLTITVEDRVLGQSIDDLLSM